MGPRETNERRETADIRNETRTCEEGELTHMVSEKSPMRGVGGDHG